MTPIVHFSSMTLKGTGPFETGCHTERGNDLCLYAQTTRHLHEAREELFADVFRRKSQWNRPERFDHMLALKAEGRRMYFDSVRAYREEISQNFSPNATTQQDFLLWLGREFQAYEIDHKTRQTA